MPFRGVFLGAAGAIVIRLPGRDAPVGHTTSRGRLSSVNLTLNGVQCSRGTPPVQALRSFWRVTSVGSTHAGTTASYR